MAKPKYEHVLKSVEKLDLKSQRRLLMKLQFLVETRKRKKYSVMDLAGLGKGIWRGVDPQKFVDRERDSWDSKPIRLKRRGRLTVALPGRSKPTAKLGAAAVERTRAAVRRVASAKAGLASLAGGCEGSDELVSLIPSRRRRR